MYSKIFLKKTHIEVGRSNLYASFGTFCLKIGQFLEAQWVFEKCFKTVKSLFSKENDVDFEFFRNFKISLCLEKLTNLKAKGAKRSVKMWTINFYKIFFKNIFLYMNSQLSKIRSVHTYFMTRTVYFDWICIQYSHCITDNTLFMLSLCLMYSIILWILNMIQMLLTSDKSVSNQHPFKHS